MLVMGRRVNERIQISDNIVITVVSIDGQTVRIAIDAPKEIPISRDEIKPFTRPYRPQSRFFKGSTSPDALHV